MKVYIVEWVKTYHATGTEEVEAKSSKEAWKHVAENIGDYEGHMEYDADADYINVVGRGTGG